MSSITNPSLITAALTVAATSHPFATDQRRQNRLALERAQHRQASRNTTTVAVHANDHGQTFAALVPAKN